MRVDSVGSKAANFCPVAIATGALLCVAGIFLILASHQVLPHGVNAISSLGVCNHAIGYSILGAGVILALIGSVMWRRSIFDKEVPNKISENSHVSVSSSVEEPPKEPPKVTVNPPTTKKELNDEEIINNLLKQGYSRPIEEGGDGRCLFWSILPQITEADVVKGEASKYANYFEGWKNLPANSADDDKLDRLRQMALAEEEDFLKPLSASSKADMAKFSPDQKMRIFELYKDMIQELRHLAPDSVRKHLAELELNSDAEEVLYQQFVYCKNSFKEYKSKTQQKYNWAGTSELIAIGRILECDVKAFGQDTEPSSLDEKGNVLPYFSSGGGSSTPIVVFQCNGGGHYRRLERIE